MVTTTEPRATLTVEQAAMVLGIGRTLAFELARTGQLPTIRLGRRLLVPRVALDRRLDSQLPRQNDSASDDAA